MFSNNLAIDPAAPGRRGRRQISRPSSRTQQRLERSTSNTSRSRNVRESSVMSGRGGSGSFAERELVHSGKTMSMLGVRGDGGKDMDGVVVDWTKNNKFRVSKLPALPSFFKTSTPIPITATVDAATGHALILAHHGAYVWHYTSTYTIPHTLSFPLPTEEQGPNSPFPLGDLVSPSANSDEPGLVVVMPISGRIAYWDSVGAAVAEGLFTKRRGVEGAVPLVSGESVTAVCNAEPAGFILSLSSGRLAHLALRDLAGRPGITVTIMRGYGTGVMGGFLGALRAGSSRRDIVAVRAGRVVRLGEREVIVATARGNFSRWLVNRSGTYANLADVDLRDNMLSAIEKAAPKEVREGNKDSFVIVDAVVGESHESASAGSHDVDVLVLASFMPSPPGYGTLHVVISLRFRANRRVDISGVHVVKCYTTPFEEGKARPRIYLPRPGKTAFLVFSRAVVLVSTHKSDAGEDDMNELEDQPVFEDVVDFRGDLNVEIVGSGPEDVAFDSTARSEVAGSFMSDTGTTGSGKKIRNPGIVLVAKGAGILRLETFDLEPVRKESLREPIKVKSKIEQAVFYGVKEDNPLNFRGRKEIEYPIAETEAAALEISSEILSSTSEYLPGLLPSLDSHLSLRATHLRALAEHLKTTFSPLSRETMWQLLSDAEKCQAARAVWNVRDAHLRHRPVGEDGVLDLIIADLSLDDDIGGSDPVRTWFLGSVGSIQELLPLAKRAIVEKSKQGRFEPVEFNRLDAEANDIVLGALLKAWDFRIRNAKLYGLDDPGVNPNGILVQATGLAPPWTSGTDILQALSVQYEVSEALLKSLWGPRLASDVARKDVTEKIAEQLAGLAEICCRGFEERSTWCEQQIDGGEGILQEGITVRERYYASRGAWIKPLVELGRLDRAYELAERWQDYRTLVELTFEELLRADVIIAESDGPNTTTNKAERDKERNEAMESKESTYERLERYFESFGEMFAVEMYEYLVEGQHLQMLLNGFENWREKYLTPFLRSNKKYAKLSWIHDVSLGEYALAAETLLEVATEQEDDQWNKKVELSIGKLAKIAATGHLDEKEVRAIDSELELVEIQNRIFQAVKFVAQSTIDEDAAVGEGLSMFASTALAGKKRAGCRRLWVAAFERAVKGKVMGVEEIADLLTLSDGGEGSGPLIVDAERGDEFFWALKALSLGGLETERRRLAEQSIWRRCFLRDDWPDIVNTRNKTDLSVEEATRETAVYKTIKLGYENGLFSNDSPYQPLTPDESFHPENEFILKSRFARADESELTILSHDLAQENKLLKRLIDRASLRAWFPGVLDAARREALSGLHPEYMEIIEE